ncbi:hypothetical protein [Clostridium hydrogeniformans]|uniref:hypothetical protein n=1 Tax=Clostridium hydrogeniformans TaxID=349933 RepID=UPI000480968A|nr:hypothetical protein [Clostridium hydrogeniformans]
MAIYIRKNLTPLWYRKEEEKKILRKIKIYIGILMVINVILSPITIGKRSGYKEAYNKSNIIDTKEDTTIDKNINYNFLLENQKLKIINFDFNKDNNYITLYFESVKEGDYMIKTIEKQLNKEMLINMKKQEQGYIYKVTF